MPDNIYEPVHVSVHRLRSTFQGAVIAPDDAAYDRARTIFYTGYSAKPAAVVRPAETRDVGRAVNFARETGAATMRGQERNGSGGLVRPGRFAIPG